MDFDLIRLMAFGLACGTVLGGAAWGVMRLLRARRTGVLVPRRQRLVAWSFVAAGVVGVACLVDAAFVEPRSISQTRTIVRTPKLLSGERLRVVVLGDLHIRGAAPVLVGLAERVNLLDPDILVFVGDTLDTKEGLGVAREVITAMHARYGSYAITGHADAALAAELGLFDGAAVMLDGRPLRLPGDRVSICGVAPDQGPALAGCLASAAPGTFRIAAFHTPDLVEELPAGLAELYVAGHTHGGQVRLPFFGALVTGSKFGKKYEMGRSDVGAMAAFVTRGIGTAAGAPGWRFLAPPEIAIIDVVGVQ